MPYHPQASLSRTSTANFDFATVNGQGQPFGPRQTLKREYDNIIFHSSRSGSNSSVADLVRQFGTDQLELVARRQTIGFFYRTAIKEIHFRDRRGRIRIRYKRYTKKVPIKVRVASFRVKKGAKNLAPDVFLKPNPLVYRAAYSFTAPQTMRIYFSKPTAASYSYRGYVDVDGPGLYDSYPLYYGPVIQYGFGLQSLPFEVPVSGLLFDQALERLYKKVYDDIPDYFTAAAESPELLSLLKRTALEGIKLVREIYRWDVKRLSGRLNSNISASDLAGLWLTWIYGIAPVVSDIADTVRIISREERIWRSFSASSDNRYVLDDSSHLDTKLAGNQRYEEHYIARYGVLLEGRLNVTKYLMRASHWQQSTGTLLEVIPYSFMLDWIIDITGYLKACTVLDKQQYIAWRTSSKKIEQAFDGKFAFNPDYPNQGVFTSEPFSARSGIFSMKRDVLSSLPDMPLPNVERPLLDTTNLQRALNVLAILVARRKTNSK